MTTSKSHGGGRVAALQRRKGNAGPGDSDERDGTHGLGLSSGRSGERAEAETEIKMGIKHIKPPDQACLSARLCADIYIILAS